MRCEENMNIQASWSPTYIIMSLEAPGELVTDTNVTS